MENKAVVMRESQPMEVARPVNIEDLLRAATERGKDGVEVMERLMTIRRELNAEQAKHQYDTSMAAFQAECPAIQRRRKGAQGSYKFAPIEDIAPVVKPLLQKHGFSFSIDTPPDVDDKGVTAIFELRHKGGHTEQRRFRVPLDTRASMMNAPQQFGAACSYAKRYAMVNALGIVIEGEDNDAWSQVKPQGPSSVASPDASVDKYRKELWELMNPVRGPVNAWDEANQYLWDNALIHDDEVAPKFTEARFKEVIAKVKGKLRV